MATEATVVLDPDGRIVEANQEALDLFGATLDELREAAPGAFSADQQSPEEAEQFKESWVAAGSPDIVGTSTLRRKDETEVRIGFGITRREDGSYLAVLRPMGGGEARAAQVFTAGEVLARWRAAERRLDEVDRSSPEWSTIQRQVDWFRRQYHAAFEGKGSGAP